MRLHTVIAATIPTALVLGCETMPASPNDAQPTGSSAEHSALSPAYRTATLWVKGLACPYCVHNVNRQLIALPGVEHVHVELATGRVSVALDTEQPASRQQLVNAIDDSGFTLDRIEMPH